MDKYTYNLKTDKIQKLVRQGDYDTASKIADTMEWNQEKNVRLLNAAAEAYEKVGKNEEAIDLLLRAYERSSAGKRILYKLTELALAAGNLKDAETFYKKYLEEAEDESNRYILRYQIAEAKDEPVERRISILEAYQKQEFEEEWACKLAELYQQTGRREKCVKLCDEIILWFGVGPYVARAMELKETFEPLTEEQKERRENSAYYEAQVQKIAEEMAEKNGDNEVEEPEEVLDPEEAEARENEAADERMANYTASVDASLIKELMEEEELEPAEDDSAAVEVFSVDEETAEEETPEEVEVEAEAEEIPEEAEVEAEEIVEEAEIEAEVEEIVEEAEVEAEAEEIVEETEVEAEAEEIVEETEVEAEAEEIVEEAETVAEAEETPEEDIQDETVFEDTEDPMGETKNLQEMPGWQDAFRQPMEDNAEPTKEIVIPKEFLMRAAEEEALVADAIAEAAEEVIPVEETPVVEVPVITPVEEPAEEAVPVISMDEIEQAELEKQVEMPETAIPEVFEHEHCLFLGSKDGIGDVDRAVDALDDYYARKDQEMSPVAKIAAAKLNQRGLIRSLPQLQQKDLIIDKANELSDEIVQELLEIVDSMDKNKIFVLMDQDDSLKDLKLRMLSLSKAPVEEPEEIEEEPVEEAEAVADEMELPEAEEEASAEDEIELPEISIEDEPESETAQDEQLIDLDESFDKEAAMPARVSFADIDPDQVLSERDFIRYAEYFAKELECSIDDSGFDALEDEMAEILKDNGNLTAGDVEDIIEEAADSAEKPGLGGVFKKKYDKDGFLILRKKNFR